MFRASNSLIAILNILTLVISVLIIGLSIWFQVHGTSQCQKFLQLPLLIMGLFLLFVSLLGLIGSCCRVTSLLWIYLVVMFLIIIGLFAFTFVAFVLTNKGAGKAISGKGYKDYRLGDYSNWLQNHVVNGKKWNGFKNCLSDSRVCRNLGRDDHQNALEFSQRNLSPIQSGCCKPPTICGFNYENATFWTIPKSGLASTEGDCLTWSNHQGTLCYDCMSCKAGVLENLKREWRKLTIANVCILIFLIVVNTIGCYAFRNNRADGRYKRYRGSA
ncbi:hypothetical protein HHK36_024367 [Tetracentron sinense]|uniref:Tetraspanin-8 n=1 Tax=Tetracentron sinense TaxID=13715 RepID=A0A834YN16_TETSI|nr:hypothetical protein HHK36_024367 [Tetracentron sinense]